jgi:hypothetical protein
MMKLRFATCIFAAFVFGFVLGQWPGGSESTSSAMKGKDGNITVYYEGETTFNDFQRQQVVQAAIGGALGQIKAIKRHHYPVLSKKSSDLMER